MTELSCVNLGKLLGTMLDSRTHNNLLSVSVRSCVLQLYRQRDLSVPGHRGRSVQQVVGISLKGNLITSKKPAKGAARGGMFNSNASVRTSAEYNCYTGNQSAIYIRSGPEHHSIIDIAADIA